jgi:hypothetical protein
MAVLQQIISSVFTSSSQPLTDSYFNSVTGLFLATGANAAQNNTLIDSSSNNFTITRTGNVTQGAFSPYSQLSWGNYFNGTTDYIQNSAPTAVLSPGTGDFTVEFWVYPVAGSRQDWINLVAATGSNRITVYYTATSIVYTAGDVSAATARITYTVAASVIMNGWHHVALSRNAGSSKLFLDGVQIGSTYADTLNWTNTMQYTGMHDPIGSTYATGWLSNVRVLKGTGLYTSNFTPSTTPLTAIANTSLLTCQNNHLVDNSANALTMTTTGTPIAEPFSPFAPASSYTTSANGGSGYFDGTTDYLTVPFTSSMNIAASTQMCFECWAQTTSSNAFIMAGRNWAYGSSGPTYGFSLTTGVTPVWNIATTGSAAFVMANSTISGPKGQWNHYVFSRDASNVVRIFVNGVLGVSRTDSQQMTNATGDIYIGESSNLASPNANGSMAGMRFVIGSVPPEYATSSTTNGAVIFTPPTAPPTNITNTLLLMNFTNGAVVDVAGKAVFETVGNAQASSTQTKFSQNSISLDGTGDWLQSAYKPEYNFYGGDFTVEYWVYISALNTFGIHLSFGGATPGGTDVVGWSAGTTGSTLYFNTNTSPVNFGTITTGGWHHVAFSRAGSSFKCFLDGTQSGSTATNSVIINNTSRPLVVGASQVLTNPLQGYMSNVRLTTGIARYTANFTAPTAAFQTL